MDQLEPGSIKYNRTFARLFRGPLDPVSLRLGLTEIVRRHSILRTIFPSIEGVPVQRILPPQPLNVALLDVSRLPESERLPEVVRLATQGSSQPFDLARDLPIRSQLIRLDPERHVLVVATHHIAFDGISESIFLRELSQLYSAARAGVAPQLPEPVIQYADYAVWERERVRGGMLDEHLAYWRTTLANMLPRQDLPSLEEGSSVVDKTAGQESLDLSGPVSEVIRSACREQGVTPFMMFASAFVVLLHRLSGSDEIVIGVPVAGRNRIELENLIGTFINTLPLRVDVSSKPTFGELLRMVKRATLEALEHQDVPFERLVEEIQPERLLTRPPIFDYLINSHVFHQPDLSFGDLEVETFPLPEVSTAYPLTFYIFSDSARYLLKMSFQTTRFSPSQVRHLLGQLAFLLEQATSRPDASVDEYSLVDSTSLGLIPDPASAIQEIDYPSVTTLVSDWTTRNPSALAVDAGRRLYSYTDLWRESARLADDLADAGLERGQVVAIVGARSFELVAGMLGVFLAGGVLLLIDPEWPRAQIEAMLARGRARFGVVAQGPTHETMWMREANGLGLHILDRGAASAAAERYDDSPSEGRPEPAPGDAAYVFFTSGTTGDPEPVLGSHKGLSHFLAWQRQTFEVGPGDRCSLLTGLSFDPILRDVFLPLTSGGTVCIPGPELSPASARIGAWIAAERITIVHGVPSLMRSWIPPRRIRKRPKDLRWIFLAGEPLGDDLVRRLRTNFASSAQIVNLYGPTETTLVKCFYVVPEDPLAGVQPLGSPLPQTQVLVLNARDQLCGLGEPGEIAIRTPYRTLGYLTPGSARQASFVPNPFSEDPNDLLYRTGDRGYYRGDGKIAFLGRLDHQVKIHGTRVEPDGVAALLSRQTGVLASAVLASKDERGLERLTAYVVPEDRALTGEELRERLAQELPAAMIPSGFVFLDRMPLTSNGKVDRQALRALHVADVRAPTEFVPPRDRLERRLVRIWEDVLEAGPIGVRDDFFDRGGHSLLAVRMFVELEKATRKRLPVRAIFEAPTVERLASLIRSESWSPPDTQLVPIQPEGTRPPVFWVHAAGGHVLAYRRLARYLGPEQPVYALQGVNLEEDRLNAADVEDMAARYVTDLQKVRPTGPYFVGGLSFGGLVAWEIAQRLRIQGHTVALLILLDTRGPRYPRPSFLSRWTLELRQRLEFHGGNLSVLGPRQKLAYLFERARTFVPRLARRTWAGVQGLWYLITNPAPRAVKRAYRGDIRARARYTPKPYAGPIAFFRAESQPGGRGEYPQMGWEGLVGGQMDIYEVPGAHVSIMAEPHLKVLAAKLSECLLTAQTAATGRRPEEAL